MEYPEFERILKSRLRKAHTTSYTHLGYDIAVSIEYQFGDRFTDDCLDKFRDHMKKIINHLKPEFKLTNCITNKLNSQSKQVQAIKKQMKKNNLPEKQIDEYLGHGKLSYKERMTEFNELMDF